MIIPCVYKTIKGYFITNKDCARETGFSAAHIGRVLNGKAAIGVTVARSISKRYKFSFKWLMSGEGSALSSDKERKMTLEEECMELRQCLLTQEGKISRI